MDKLAVEKSGAPYIFRYRNDNNFTIDEIKNNYIYFPNSEMLNDPFDASHKLVKIDENESSILNRLMYLREDLEMKI